MSGHTLARVTLVAGLVSFVPAISCAADAGKSAFEKRFFEPIVVSTLGVDSEHFAQLGAAEIGELDVAKSVLGGFFKSLEDPTGNPLEFMTPTYSRELSSRTAVRKSVVADETTVLEVALSGYHFLPNPKSLELRYFAVVMSDGAFQIGTGNVIMNKVGSTWRIAKISAGE